MVEREVGRRGIGVLLCLAACALGIALLASRVPRPAAGAAIASTGEAPRSAPSDAPVPLAAGALPQSPGRLAVDRAPSVSLGLDPALAPSDAPAWSAAIGGRLINLSTQIGRASCRERV